MSFTHKPVLLHEVITNLVWNQEGFYIDATFGRGGHSLEILRSLNDKGRLLALDRDLDAVALGRKIEDLRFNVRHKNFSLLKEVVKEFDWIGKVSGILLDLGVSSPQLDDASRGFSFLQDGPLDMRMDVTQRIKAADWLARASFDEIASVLWEYGEERFSRRIARAILKAREISPIQNTINLSEIISKAIPKWEKYKHPATRSFQAIRIFINNELNEIETCLSDSLEILAHKGRLLVITFHSLEEQIMKKFIRKNARSGAEIPSEIPIREDEFPPRIKLIGKPLIPSDDEILENPRARSAKLRVMEKLI